MEQNKETLDVEFKRYLKILRPYLEQIEEKEAIRICNQWIQRLSSCRDEDKPMRNRYIFVLCYQLAKGILDEPFINGPPNGELPSISEITGSDSSSECEYNLTNNDNQNTKVIFDRKPNENEYLFQSSASERSYITGKIDQNSSNTKQPILCSANPKEIKACATGNQETDIYESRANNLIMRLRDIKKQNILLKKELTALKEECKETPKKSFVNLLRVDNATCTYERVESNTNVNTLKSRIQALSEERECLLNTLEEMQSQLDKFEENKKIEIENLEAKHQLHLRRVKLSLREENKTIYEEKLQEIKEHYEYIIADMEKNEALSARKLKNDMIMDFDKFKQEMIKEIEVKDNEIQKKAKEILDKDNIINSQSIEITQLKSQLKEQTNNFNSMMDKFFVKPAGELDSEKVQLKTAELEKRLNRMEKSKARCLKAYEAKLTGLQREKHLVECSLQLQLVKQRAQIVNEIAEENQTELAAALDKLEVKYKEIVENVQSTAIQRRLQDEMAVNAILEAACACGLRNEVFTNQSQLSAKTASATPKKEVVKHCDSEISGVVLPKDRMNRSYLEESMGDGFCLNSERLGELFDQVCVPIRDVDSAK